MKKLCMRCYISGKVQRVWFRAFTQREAEKLNINGWVRNLPDGRVEVFACGTESELELLYAWLQQGPQYARVDDHSREHLPWEDYDGFDIL
ncbi:acylphosphatase [Legionella fallonii]|uniref:acylphosphatase n=1 Tax=Legionella fallonii LLAP-10 TaxID=1212491 RepID=A0A098G6S8_9GAMM|nr:acylphosphatase [Legionella fallonii]CEG57195.1 Acylphosphatase [Legionella fallonii LLAP-10]